MDCLFQGRRRRGRCGKLKEAARRWAYALLGRSDPTKPLKVDAEDVRQAAALGFKIEIEDDGESELLEVWERNWMALLLFLACETQWSIVAGMGGVSYVGLDYAAVDIVMKHRGFDAAAFAGLQIMEQEALRVLNERD